MSSKARFASQSRTPDYGVGRENLTVRALVSNTEAEIIIGDRHANIHRVQEETGVYAGVSEAVRGVKDQILAVTGTVEGVVKAFSLVAYHLASLRVEPTDSSSESPLSPHPPTKLRILMPHRILPDVVGRDGKKIKAIQDSTGASLGVTGKMLLRSTECLVAVHGSPEAIGKAVEQIVMSVPKDSGFGKGTILFKPGTGDASGRRSTLGHPSATPHASQLWEPGRSQQFRGAAGRGYRRMKF